MTDTEALKALVALAKKAGAHEWAIDGDDRPGMEWNNFIVQADARHMTVCFMAHAEGDNSELEAAAEFIAAAKNAIPALERLLASPDANRQEPVACKNCGGKGRYSVDKYDRDVEAWLPEWIKCDCQSAPSVATEDAIMAAAREAIKEIIASVNASAYPLTEGKDYYYELDEASLDEFMEIFSKHLGERK